MVLNSLSFSVCDDILDRCQKNFEYIDQNTEFHVHRLLDP